MRDRHAHIQCASILPESAMRTKEDRAGYLKRAANLSVNAELLDQAKALEINLSATFERALEAEVRARKGEAWLAENREGVAAYNAWVAEHGVLSPMFRKR
jgi:antitoxin CcdA